MKNLFDYREAFSRNLGIISAAEQNKLRNICVAIPGLGGVGGAHIEVLARLGIGHFKIADFDHFELANFNRQFGATMETLGKPKTDVLAARINSINPTSRVEQFPNGISVENLDLFLAQVDIVVDSLDGFAIDARCALFRKAYDLNIPVVTAGPVGFGAAVQVVLPGQTSFDEFYGIREEMSANEKIFRFLRHWRHEDSAALIRIFLILISKIGAAHLQQLEWGCVPL